MKLSAYAKQVGITYKTAYQWWKAGQLDAYQLPTGTLKSRHVSSSALNKRKRRTGGSDRDDSMSTIKHEHHPARLQNRA
jgi:predicted site-specific integrase-resolvase